MILYIMQAKGSRVNLWCLGGNSFQYVDFQQMWNVFVLKDYKSNFLKSQDEIYTFH